MDTPLSPFNVQQGVSAIQRAFEDIKKQAQSPHPDAQGIAEGLEQLEDTVSHFFTHLNRQPHDAENEIKHIFKTIHTNFLRELDEIKNEHESLHDTLYEPQKLKNFVEELSHQSPKELRHLSMLVERFSKELRKTFEKR